MKRRKANWAGVVAWAAVVVGGRRCGPHVPHATAFGPSSILAPRRNKGHQPRRGWDSHGRRPSRVPPPLFDGLSSSSLGDNATSVVIPPPPVVVVEEEEEEHDAVDTAFPEFPTTAAAATTTTTTIKTTTTSPHPTPPPRLLQELSDRFLGGMELTPEVMAIVTVYFVQGALGLARLAKTYLLKEELHLGPAEMSALTGAFALPWTIKPMYGFLTDGFPLWGYRRKTYLLAAGVVGSLSYALLGWADLWETGGGTVPGVPASAALPGTMALLLLASASVAMSDVVTDGIVVTRTRQAAQQQADDKDARGVAGSLQSLCWGASATGSILSAYFSGSLLESMPVRSVFAFTALLPLLVATIALQIDERPVGVPKGLASTTAPTTATAESSRAGEHITAETTPPEPTALDNIQQQVEALWGAFRQDAIWKPALFIFLWQSTPTADGAFFYFLTNELNLGPEFMGRVSLASSVATLVGVALYNQYLKRVPIKDILFWSSIASVPLGLVPVLLVTHVNQQLGIPDQALIYGDDVVLAALGEMAFLPTLVLAARLCPPGIEAVLFATLMSIFNGASTVGTELGAALTKLFGITETNFDNLTALLIVCNLTSLYPLVWIGWLDRVGDQSEEALETAVVMDTASATTKDDSFSTNGHLSNIE